MDNIVVYGVHETLASNPRHKRLVCLFETEKSAQGYAKDMDAYEASLSDPSEPYVYVVEKWIVSKA